MVQERMGRAHPRLGDGDNSVSVAAAQIVGQETRTAWGIVEPPLRAVMRDSDTLLISHVFAKAGSQQ